MDNNEHSTNLAEVGTDAISRADAIKIVQNRCKRNTTACVLAVTEIRNLPPLQPKITHCKDCKHWIFDGVMVCERFTDASLKEDDFCSYGER